MSKVILTRRTLLASLGLAGGSLLLPSVVSRRTGLAWGGSPTPMRLIIAGSPHGVVYPTWEMRPPGLSGPEGKDWQFSLTGPAVTFSRNLAPFQPLAKKTLILDGLAQWPGVQYPFNAHDVGCIGAFTGTAPVDAGAGVYVAGGASIDQVVSQQIAPSSTALALGGYYRGYIYDKTGVGVPSFTDPVTVYNNVFASTPITGSNDDDSNVSASQASVIGLLQNQYGLSSSLLSGADQQKLLQHQQALLDLEAQIKRLATLKCTPPGTPTATDPSQNSTGAPGVYKAANDAFTAMIVAAFSCDITRVVSWTFQGPANTDIGVPPGNDIHQVYAHHVEDGTNPMAPEYMTRFHTFDAQAVADLALALDAVPEGDGTLLDHTLILYSGELATGGHHLYGCPTVLIGGGAGFTMGRYVHYAQDVSLTSNGLGYNMGAPHNKMLTSIANAFGVSGSFGDSSVVIQGESANLTGTLDYLT